MRSSSYSFIGGVAPKKAKRRHSILLSSVTYWPPVEMLLGSNVAQIAQFQKSQKLNEEASHPEDEK
jgi:hypothetical protein